MIDKNAELKVTRYSTDNGEHSHFGLIDIRNGSVVWEEEELQNSPPPPPPPRHPKSKEEKDKLKILENRIRILEWEVDQLYKNQKE